MVYIKFERAYDDKIKVSFLLKRILGRLKLKKRKFLL